MCFFKKNIYVTFRSELVVYVRLHFGDRILE
jgi:hypothetical protein